jgi:hypothetical protein
MTMIAMVGCSRNDTQHSPTIPGPPVSTSAAPAYFGYGYVVDSTGVCLEGATVQQIVDGQAVGQSVAQTMPCNAWDYSNGFSFKPPVPSVEVTIRAAAPGWTSCDITFAPQSNAPIATTAAVFWLSKIGDCKFGWDF